jgi:hypothetical protein
VSRYAQQVEKIRAYWATIFGTGSPVFHSCVALSVTFLAALYVLGLPYMVLASLVRAFLK